MSPTYPEVTIVNLPSSFMIVISITPSYTLLAYHSRFLDKCRLIIKDFLIASIFR
ncbi:hypothetical protein CCM_09678 [Cordyceps militaris CM01]|uniref:Uncharacterized protein n=1 Tax=Cordyceps militaris (strain CM01) TaxID=983644 RepID=G3JV37_CORMM|nr:uncharacterized protein CCM_09678 [Cordyceps militaris CM01]EGX87623.1 hypothetical protein CCM_09678 [Cordyceps militaris CM01]